MDQLEFSILGALVVGRGETEIRVAGTRRRAVLLRLLVSANQPVPARLLAEDAWDGKPPPGAVSRLQSHISLLRQALGADRIGKQDGGYVIWIGENELDGWRFERDACAGREALSSGDLVEAAARLGRALGRWRGPALQDVADRSWALGEVARLEELRLAATEAWLEARLALGDHDGVAAAAEAAVAAHPVREGLWQQLMLSLYRSGRQADALAAYQRVRRHLGDELGLAPSPELRALEEAILLQRPELGSGLAPFGSPAPAADERSELAPAAMPSGTVTFLFTDIEGSTKLLTRLGRDYAGVLERHRELLRRAVATDGGVEVSMEGDGYLFAFGGAADAVAAAVAGQRALADEPWPEGADIRVRMGMDSGEAKPSGRDYVALVVHRAARVSDAGHGGQILVSEHTAALVAGLLGESTELALLGRYSLKDFHQPAVLFQVRAPGLAESFPALRALPAARHNLPSTLSSFVGREDQIRKVDELLGDARLVTITGPGGSGKTRLSLQVAAGAVDAYRHGVWFADLASLTDPDLVARRIADAVGIREVADVPVLDVLCAALNDRQMLIVVDNCEHVLRSCAAALHALLSAAPAVQVLATSREPLGVPGERHWTLPPLDLPDAGESSADVVLSSESVRLFLERAGERRPDISVGQQDIASLVEIVRRLDGIPLALELAAARTTVLSLPELASRLDNRFRLLTTGPSTAPRRQQTLLSTIDWSHDHLSDTEQAVFRRLSVFAGSFTLEAAETVVACDDDAVWILDVIDGLANKSLITVDRRESSVRYRLLETIRAYARQKLAGTDEEAEYLRRHFDRMLDVAGRAAPKLGGLEAPRWLDLLEVEHDDVRAALEYGLAFGREADALRLAVAVSAFWDIRCYFVEGRSWLERLLPTAPAESRVAGLLALAELAYSQRDSPRAYDACAEAIELARAIGHRHEESLGLANLGNVALTMGDIDAARDHLHASIELGREVGATRAVALALTYLGSLEGWNGNYAGGTRMLEESRDLLVELGEVAFRANAIQMLGELATEQGHWDEAQAWHEESLALRLDIGDRHGVACQFGCLAHTHLGRGDFEIARHYAEQYLEGSREFGDRAGVCYSLGDLGEIARVEGDLAAARHFLEESIAVIPEGTDPYSRLISIHRLGTVARDEGTLDEGIELELEALRLAEHQQDVANISNCLEGLAQIVTARHDLVRAVYLFAVSNGNRRRIGVPVPTYLVAEREHAVAQLRASLDQPAFETAWSAGARSEFATVVHGLIGEGGLASIPVENGNVLVRPSVRP
jgi:predicted ATPase/DNA-binding SARP family transcriptional activator/class 3 adenylate cyclase